MKTDIEDIQIADIEKELGILHEAHKASQYLAACLFNLIIYCEGHECLTFIQEIKKSIVSKFPCRIIFIQLSNAPEVKHIRVNVSSETIGKIACDQIIIEVSKHYLERVPFIIFPHLVPDLPLYLLWGQDPTRDKDIFPHLAPLANRLIFKVDDAKEFLPFRQKIVKISEEYPKLELIDINWVLISGWRTVFQQIFDTEEHLKHLENITTLSIFFSDLDHQNNELQSIYLMCWLANQLEWEFLTQETQENKYLFHFKKKNPIKVTLHSQQYKDIYPGTIVGLDIATSDNYFYVISPIPNLPKVIVHISQLETCALPFTLPLANLKPGFQYVKEIFFTPPSEHYKNLLHPSKINSWKTND